MNSIYVWCLAHPVVVAMSTPLALLIGWVLPNESLKKLGFNISQMIRKCGNANLEKAIEEKFDAIDEGMHSDNK
jgi:hypothetical protein